ncbi:hypothetical protein K378_02989 [Streptomyces sp. Amel2xB2]|nr:hypothetical protein K378_02989 [Streptomyces sp. Amel2xB2]
MACNCGGGRARRRAEVHRLILPNGTVRDYATRQEALAARNRMGGNGRIVVVNR